MRVYVVCTQFMLTNSNDVRALGTDKTCTQRRRWRRWRRRLHKTTIKLFNATRHIFHSSFFSFHRSFVFFSDLWGKIHHSITHGHDANKGTPRIYKNVYERTVWDCSIRIHTLKSPRAYTIRSLGRRVFMLQNSGEKLQVFPFTIIMRQRAHNSGAELTLYVDDMVYDIKTLHCSLQEKKKRFFFLSLFCALVLFRFFYLPLLFVFSCAHCIYSL